MVTLLHERKRVWLYSVKPGHHRNILLVDVFENHLLEELPDMLRLAQVYITIACLRYFMPKTSVKLSQVFYVKLAFQ